MKAGFSRREFLTATSAAAALSAAPAWAVAGAPVRFGYAAITWGDAVPQALDDIAAVGFPGVQLRNNVLKQMDPAKLKDTLAAHKLTFVALSSGDVALDKPADEQIAEHTAHAKYIREAGGLYMQILDAGKPWPRSTTPDECVRLGKLLTELGKRVTDAGIQLGYHNHLNTISEKPEHLAIVLENADPRYVKLELDVAHSYAGGGDPVKQIAEYHDRLLFLHLKDVVPHASSAPGRYPFQWVELGQGKVDLQGVFVALKKVNFGGWAVAELDSVPVPGRTPKQSAQMNYDYIRKAGYKI